MAVVSFVNRVISIEHSSLPSFVNFVEEHYVTAAESEQQWKQMETILQETTAEGSGLSTRKHQICFDEADKEIQELLEKERSCHNRLIAKT